MDRIARRWASQGGVADRCRFIDGDLPTHDLKPDSFDVVVAPGVFDYILKPGPALRRLCELASDRVGASFPARYRLLMPVRKARLESQHRPVRFYARGELEAMAGATGADIRRPDDEGSWISGWHWLVLGVP